MSLVINIKKVLIAVCIGGIVGVLYDTISPEYTYYNDYKQKITKEVYLRDIRERESDSGEYSKKKQISKASIIMAGAVATLSFILIPISTKTKQQA